MARLARVVIPNMPHLITLRGNRGLQTFFCDEDYQAYVELMAEWSAACKVQGGRGHSDVPLSRVPLSLPGVSTPREIPGLCKRAQRLLLQPTGLYQSRQTNRARLFA